MSKYLFSKIEFQYALLRTVRTCLSVFVHELSEVKYLNNNCHLVDSTNTDIINVISERCH